VHERFTLNAHELGSVPQGVAAAANTIGFGLLILLMLAITASDIFKLIGYQALSSAHPDTYRGGRASTVSATEILPQ
jgi:hypothetical protein